MDMSQYTTFATRAPLKTHFRQATCEEVGCHEFLYGWKLRWDVLSEEDRHLVTHCGRKYVIDQEWIIFEAGQPCFALKKHRTRIDRPEIFLRKNSHLAVPAAQTGGAFVHHSAEDWLDDFRTTTDRVTQQLKEG